MNYVDVELLEKLTRSQWINSSKPFHPDVNVLVCIDKCVAYIELKFMYTGQFIFLWLC